jgi:hypothetical protein
VRLPGYLARRPVLLIIVVLILSILFGFLLGYRLGPGLSIVKIGSVTLTDLPPGTTIYVNEVLSETPKTSEATIALLPGTHSFLLGFDSYYPWAELITVPSGGKLSVRPIFIAHSADETTLHDADRDSAERAIDTLALPTKDSPLLVYDGCVGVYVETGNLFAAPVDDASCEPLQFLCYEEDCATAVLPSENEAVRAVIRHPTREDTVIVALGKAIYAVEVDSRSPQYVAPILRESFPEIAPWSETSFAVREGGAVFSVTLP